MADQSPNHEFVFHDGLQSMIFLTVTLLLCRLEILLDAFAVQEIMYP